MTIRSAKCLGRDGAGLLTRCVIVVDAADGQLHDPVFGHDISVEDHDDLVGWGWMDGPAKLLGGWAVVPAAAVDRLMGRRS